MKKTLLFLIFWIVFLCAWCTSSENEFEDEVEDSLQIEEQDSTVSNSSQNVKKQKKDKKSDQDVLWIETNEVDEVDEAPKTLVVDFENGYSRLKAEEKYRNETYKMQVQNSWELDWIVNISSRDGKKMIEFFFLCPTYFAGYEIDPSRFVNNDMYKGYLFIDEDYRIWPVKEIITDDSVDVMRECLKGNITDCMYDHFEPPYLLSELEEQKCKGNYSSDAECLRYNELVQAFGKIQ